MLVCISHLKLKSHIHSHSIWLMLEFSNAQIALFLNPVPVVFFLTAGLSHSMYGWPLSDLSEK